MEQHDWGGRHGPLRLKPKSIWHKIRQSRASMLDSNLAGASGRPVVVAGLTLNGASVLRRLVRLGYTPWGVSFEPDEPGWHVRGARHHLTPHPMREPEAWVDDLQQFAE